MGGGLPQADGWSALMMAAANGHVEMAQLLIAKGADAKAVDVG